MTNTNILMQEVTIADYNMTRFPSTQDESSAIGRGLAARLTASTRRLIAQSFQDVFNKNWDDSLLPECQRVRQGEGEDATEMLMWRNRPFLRLLGMREEFKRIDNEQHMIIHQQYQVM